MKCLCLQTIGCGGRHASCSLESNIHRWKGAEKQEGKARSPYKVLSKIQAIRRNEEGKNLDES